MARLGIANRPVTVSEFEQQHKPLIIAGAGSIEAKDLTLDEAALFNDGLYRLGRQYGIVGAQLEALYDLLMDWYEEFLFACMVGKLKFDQSFGGANPGGSQYGMSFIRPKVFGAAYETSYWWQTFTSTGWQNVWGSSGSLITMPDTSGTRAQICFPMIMSGSASPKVHEVRFHVEGTDYPIWNIKPWHRIGDIYVATLPGCIVVGPGSGFYMRANVDQVGNDELFPLGIELAISTYMRTE